MIKVYAFDFDGVLIENHKELPYFSSVAWKKMGKKVRVSSEEIVKFRPYAKNAAELYALMFLLDNNRQINKKRIRNTVAVHKENAERFAKLFYEERQRLQTKNTRKWLSFYKKIDFAVNLFNTLVKSSKVYIVSSKDKKTIVKLVRNFGIKINEKNILAKEISFDKLQHIDLIRKTEDVDYSEILFIDDAIDHLKPLAAKGVNTVLASWGYTTGDDIKEAKRLGITILTKDNSKSLLTTDNINEHFVHVDENNKVIGKVARKEAHEKGLWHRAVHILILNSKNEILLQKRSLTKDLYKGYWIDSAAGHVAYGETYESAAKREMKEEIGINPELKKIFDFRKFTGNDNEFIRVFFGRHEGPFKINKEELDFVKFFSLEKISKMMKTEKFTPATVQIISEINKNPPILKKLLSS